MDSNLNNVIQFLLLRLSGTRTEDIYSYLQLTDKKTTLTNSLKNRAVLFKELFSPEISNFAENFWSSKQLFSLNLYLHDIPALISDINTLSEILLYYSRSSKLSKMQINCHLMKYSSYYRWLIHLTKRFEERNPQSKVLISNELQEDITKMGITDSLPLSIKEQLEQQYIPCNFTLRCPPSTLSYKYQVKENADTLLSKARFPSLEKYKSSEEVIHFSARFTEMYTSKKFITNIFSLADTDKQTLNLIHKLRQELEIAILTLPQRC